MIANDIHTLWQRYGKVMQSFKELINHYILIMCWDVCLQSLKNLEDHTLTALFSFGIKIELTLGT